MSSNNFDLLHSMYTISGIRIIQDRIQNKYSYNVMHVLTAFLPMNPRPPSVHSLRDMVQAAYRCRDSSSLQKVLMSFSVIRQVVNL